MVGWLMLIVVSLKAEFPRWYQPAVFCCISHTVPLFEVEDALTVTVDGVCLIPSYLPCSASDSFDDVVFVPVKYQIYVSIFHFAHYVGYNIANEVLDCSLCWPVDNPQYG